MKHFMPLESFLKYGKSRPIRLIYYPVPEPGPWEFNEEETKALK